MPRDIESMKKAAQLFDEGLMLYKVGVIDKALGLFNQALALQPENEQVLYFKGNALRMLEWHREAIKCYEEATRIDPSYADAWGNMGVSYGKLGKHSEALKCFEKALTIHPADSQWQEMRDIARRKVFS